VRPDGKRVIVPDPVFGPMVTNLFGWFATGEYGLKALAKHGHFGGDNGLSGIWLGGRDSNPDKQLQRLPSYR
jgi:hypothetical protein